jgi:hypothetical protein
MRYLRIFASREELVLSLARPIIAVTAIIGESLGDR